MKGYLWTSFLATSVSTSLVGFGTKEYTWVTRSRTTSFCTHGVSFFLCSSIVGALIAAMMDGRHIHVLGTLNGLMRTLGAWAMDVDDATDSVS